MGFFTAKETESVSRPGGKKYSCISCGLYKNALTPKMEPYGGFKKKILIVGSHPDEFDDKRGTMWNGRAGRYLKKAFDKCGISVEHDCLSINAANCLPTDKNGDVKASPSKTEIDCCRKVVVSKVIRDYAPNVIIPVGENALYSILGKHWKKDLDGLEKWHGFCIPDQTYNAWVCPIWDPTHVEHMADRELLYDLDIQRALYHFDKPVPVFKQPEIVVLDDISNLVELVNSNLIVIDFETTGKKPHAKGHSIICVCVAVSADLVYVFMTDGLTLEELKPLLTILADKSIKKMGANIKYEDTWAKVIFKTKIKGWIFDTMLSSHVLDNRENITGLKFQSYVNFGIVDYSSEIEPYFQSDDPKNSNAINHIRELTATEEGRNKLLKYCAMDGILEYLLGLYHKSLIDNADIPF